MKLLRFIDTLDPSTGGPAAGIRAVTPLLATLGVATTIVTTDTPDAPYPVPLGATVVRLGPARGFLKRSRRIAPWLEVNLAGYDAVIVHALWQGFAPVVREACRRAKIPYFVYPHGMLDPWFKHAYPLKHLKKALYWRAIETRVLRDAAAVLYTCEEERRLAASTFSPYRSTERVVNYGTVPAPGDPKTQLAAWHAAQPELVARPYILFLGRLHQKKGVELLLEAYHRHADENPRPPALVLAGPAEDPVYAADLRARAARLPARAKVIFPGHLSGDVKWGALRGAEAFALISHQENFGIAVAEALAAGTPVLISDQVNIWREIVADGAGFAAADSAEGGLELLRRWEKLTAAERAEMRLAAADCHRQRYHVEAVASSLVTTLAEFVPAFRPDRP